MASSERIVITSSNVNKVVSGLKTEQEKITGYITNLDTELGKVNEAWKGADAIKYTEKMKDDYSVLLTNLNECLGTHIEFLSKVYSEYERIDNEFTGKTIEV